MSETVYLKYFLKEIILNKIDNKKASKITEHAGQLNLNKNIIKTTTNS